MVARIAGRDEKALAELYDLVAPRLLGLIQRILPERREAEEVLERVFVRLWKEAPELDRHQVGASVWMTLAARSAALERLRALRGAAAGSAPALVLPSRAWLPRRHEARGLDERQALLKKVLRQLPKEQLAALELAFFGGWSEAELAAKLRQPAGKVRAELRAGMRFLRHRLRAVLGTWAASL